MQSITHKIAVFCAQNKPPTFGTDAFRFYSSFYFYQPIVLLHPL